MNEEQQLFLEDTRDVLIGYDGCHTEQELKGLIDEARERINAVLQNQVHDYNASLTTKQIESTCENAGEPYETVSVESMPTGIEVKGAFFNAGDTDLTWDEFIEKIELVGLQYGGKSLPIQDDGTPVENPVYGDEPDTVNTVKRRLAMLQGSLERIEVAMTEENAKRNKILREKN